MKIILGNWKYIVKNFFFLLPFALLPAIFLALSFDQVAIGHFIENFFSGNLTISLYMLFRTWSLIRVDSWLGVIYSVCLILSVSVFMALMLCLVEKHMRIGKRTLSGAFTQLWNNLLTTLFITLLYVILYELWALVVSVILYWIGDVVGSGAGGYVLVVLSLMIMLFVLVYCASIFYLWYPCLQNTGFSLYEGFRYSYQLLMNVRAHILISFAIMYVTCCAIVSLSAAFLAPYLFYPIAFVLFIFIFLDFCIRMETVYFTADRLEREDERKGYRGLFR